MNAPGTTEGRRRKIKAKPGSRERNCGNTIIDIKTREGPGVLSDYETQDRSTSRGRGTMNSDRPNYKYKSGISTSKNDDTSYISILSPNNPATPELESINEILAVSLPDERSRKARNAPTADRNEKNRRF